MATSEPSIDEDHQAVYELRAQGLGRNAISRAAIICVDASKGYWPGPDDANQMANR
ncbi:hypothetical protein [Streptomyces globisporus]|uniref:hypothetical protein n=1 Tax=Streptomyces globisporus TaxID=1908 RepID=UPI000AA11DC6|nr:hypothetical protein [Streptomyces globisporus]